MDAVGESGGGGLAAQPIAQTAATHQREPIVGECAVAALERLQRLDQHVLALARHKATDAQNERRPVEAERLPGGRRVGRARQRVSLGLERRPQHFGPRERPDRRTA